MRINFRNDLHSATQIRSQLNTPSALDAQTTIGTTAHFEGIVLCATAVVLQTGASMNGRILATLWAGPGRRAANWLSISHTPSPLNRKIALLASSTPGGGPPPKYLPPTPALSTCMSECARKHGVLVKFHFPLSFLSALDTGACVAS